LQVVEAALHDAQLGIDAIDWLLLHQANQRILDSASQRLKVGLINSNLDVLTTYAGGQGPCGWQCRSSGQACSALFITLCCAVHHAAPDSTCSGDLCQSDFR
jgi:3-Oxoacyl-[acyl-carrier-protein (ACP)] synthase III C terminal